MWIEPDCCYQRPANLKQYDRIHFFTNSDQKRYTVLDHDLEASGGLEAKDYSYTNDVAHSTASKGVSGGKSSWVTCPET